jgi:hypothetical protein
MALEPENISPHSSKVCNLNSQTLFGLLALPAKSFTKAVSTFTEHQNVGASPLCWILK